MQLEALTALIRVNNADVIERLFRSLNISVIMDSHKTLFLLKSNPEDKTYHLNGVIIHKSGQILCVPHRRLLKTESKIDLKNYRVYPAVNGTVINIYFNGSTMCISTSRGMDVTEYALFGKHSYKNILNELLAQYGLSRDVFQPGYSYTMVISHPEYHWINIRTLTFISKYNLNRQQFEDDERLSPLGHIERPRQLMEKYGIGLLRHEASIAHLGYVACFPAETLTHSPQLFGFVLRCVDNSKPDYYIESSLMKVLRTVIYRNYAPLIKPEQRLERIMMSAYLCKIADDLAIKILGSIYEEYIEKYDKMAIDMNKYIGEMQKGTLVRGSFSENWHIAAEAIAKKNGQIYDISNLTLLLAI